MEKDRIKFLLINPTSEYWRRDNRPRPRVRTKAFRFSMYTSLCVASSAPDYVETQILDEDIEDIDFETDADVVGVTFMTFNAPRAYEIGDYFRREKNKVVFFGGFHPTFMPEEAIEHCDSVCVGEAENKLGKMFDDYRNGNLKKFYRECSQADLSKRIKIKRELIKSSNYVPFDVVQATRGCPNQCKFCSISSFYQHEFRTKPVDDVIEEIRELGHYLLFIDDNIIANREYAVELFTKMIPLNKKWISQSSISLAGDPKLLDLSARSGCIGLFLGLESVEQANLDKWEKDFNTSKNYIEEIKKIHAARIAVCGGIVLGADSDNRETFRKTLQFLYDAKVDALQATILTPFPGTQLFKEFEESGRIIDYNWEHYDFSHVVFEPANMSRETLKAGHDWILSNYYSIGSISARIFKEVQYLRKGMILKATLPLNLNYRSRLMLNNTISKKFMTEELVS